MNPEKLRQRISTGHVAVVAGTGVSLSATENATIASWSGLLQHGIDWCVVHGIADEEWAGRKRTCLVRGKVGEWIAVASEVEWAIRGQSPGAYREWLQETIGKLAVTNERVPRALGRLDCPILTFNYDDVLETVLKRRPTTWRDHAKAQLVIQGSRNDVLHLHGHWDTPDSVILGLQSYGAILERPAAQALQNALRTTRSLVYVGCGGTFEDPNVSRWLSWARETFRGDEVHGQFVVVAKENEGDVRALFSGADRIEIITYEGAIRT